MPEMSREPAITFASQLRSARLAALEDAEAFDGIIHAIERIGGYLCKESLGDKGQHGSLEKYKRPLKHLVKSSGVEAIPGDKLHLHPTPFIRLYEMLTASRNDALHQGAFARQLTAHAIEVAIILEEALNTFLYPVASDFMVRNPLCAEIWQPISFVRQQMLANSFSYLPVLINEKEWRVLSDLAVARFVGGLRKGEARTTRLALTVEKAVALEDGRLSVLDAEFVDEALPLDLVVARLDSIKAPVLLIKSPAHPGRLNGMLTAFDLL